jgi:hypothetical protein
MNGLGMRVGRNERARFPEFEQLLPDKWAPRLSERARGASRAEWARGSLRLPHVSGAAGSARFGSAAWSKVFTLLNLLRIYNVYVPNNSVAYALQSVKSWLL